MSLALWSPGGTSINKCSQRLQEACQLNRLIWGWPWDGMPSLFMDSEVQCYKQTHGGDGCSQSILTEVLSHNFITGFTVTWAARPIQRRWWDKSHHLDRESGLLTQGWWHPVGQPCFQIQESVRESEKVFPFGQMQFLGHKLWIQI